MKTTQLILALLATAPLLGCPKKFPDGASDGGGSAANASSSVDPSIASAPAKPAIFDVCAAIPFATVASTTGVPVNGVEPPNDSGIPTCAYRTNGKTPKIVIQKSLSTIAGVKSLWGGGKDIPGVGDAAYLTPHAGELDVQKGKTVIRVAYEVGPAKVTDDQKLDVLTKLANLALPVLAK
jgi:hypothetical protein